MQDWVKALDKEKLKQAIDARIADAMTHFMDSVRDYDVNNEMMTKSYFRTRLGKPVYDWMYQRAHKTNPQARLFINDYCNFGQYDDERFVKHVQGFLDRAVPVGGVGLQAHYERHAPATKLLLEQLDRLARLKLPVQITEFTVEGADEQRKAADLERVLRICFSHPAVDGFWIWAMWEGATGKPSAALWKQDWTPTPSAEAYRRLVYGQWWTKAEATTDATGACSVRAFYGTHRIEAGDKEKVVDLAREAKRAEVTFP